MPWPFRYRPFSIRCLEECKQFLKERYHLIFAIYENGHFFLYDIKNLFQLCIQVVKM